MIQVAFVKPSGEIDYIISPGSDGLVTDRQYYEGNLAVHISSDEDAREYQKRTVWNFETEEWATRPTQPSYYHTWEDGTWRFQSEPFWAAMRNKRDEALSKSDWSQLPDAPLSEEAKLQWKEYRQSLRDLPENSLTVTMLAGISWPTPPAT
jgi:hypothetical protein